MVVETLVQTPEWANVWNQNARNQNPKSTTFSKLFNTIWIWITYLNYRGNITKQPTVSLKQTRIYYHTNTTKVSAIWANGHDIRMDSSTTTSNILKVTSAGCCFLPSLILKAQQFSQIFNPPLSLQLLLRIQNVC